MRNYPLLVLSVILLNGIFHCPDVQAESLNHACHDQAECVFEGDSNCPESSEIAISKKRTLEIDVDISVDQRRIQYLHLDLSKVCGPTPHLQLNFPPKFLSHQAFLI